MSPLAAGRGLITIDVRREGNGKMNGMKIRSVVCAAGTDRERRWSVGDGRVESIVLDRHGVVHVEYVDGTGGASFPFECWVDEITLVREDEGEGGSTWGSTVAGA